MVHDSVEPEVLADDDDEYRDDENLQEAEDVDDEHIDAIVELAKRPGEIYY